MFSLNGTPGPEGPEGPPGADGQDGADGLSAYEIWLDLGNTGTEDDFIASLEGPAGQDGSAKAVEMAGYDIGVGLTVTSTTYQMWNWSGGSFGNTNITVGPDDKILVNVSAVLYKSGAVVSNTLHAEICPCYSETFTDPVVTPFRGITRARFFSSGSSEMNQISSAFVFSNLEGNFNFSLCLRKVSSSDPDFVLQAPKVSVVVY